jgi:hypothetical protein
MKVLTFNSSAALPVEVSKMYRAMGQLPDGRYCGIHRLLYHWTLHVDVHEMGYEERYCYETFEGAMMALMNWDGKGDPEGWHRHPTTGRRRAPDGHEWVER